MEAELEMEVVILVVLEMCMSLLGIVCNLLIVATVRQDETLRATTLNFLLFNLCFSNLLIAFFVKPISAIYTGYAMSTNEWQVGLAFCTLYTFTYRTTWCVFPFTLIAMCWCKLLAQCRCGRCGILCCARDKKNPKGSSTPGKNADTLPLTVRYETPPESKTINSILGKSDNKKGSPGGTAISIPFCDTTTELSVVQHRKTGNDFSPQRLSHHSGSFDRPTPPLSKNESHKHLEENGSLLRDGTPSLAFSGIDDFKDPIQQKVIRTLEDGPTSRQKALVVSIWILSALFGASTCFPDKVFGGTVGIQLIAEEDPRKKYLLAASNGTNVTAPIRDVDLSYCSVKTGVNDLLDYMAISVSLIIPFVIGPLIVGVFQGLFAMFGLFVCRSEHVDERGQSSGPHRRENAPSWPIIIGFTIVFLATYPLHMYVAEVYLSDPGSSFAFLIAKYCIGFLYVIFIPIVTLCLQKEIRVGIATVFGSAVMCLQLQEIRRSNSAQQATSEGRDVQSQLQTI